MAKADNTRRAYRGGVCAWCLKRDLPPLPDAGADVAALLAGERGMRLSPETLKLRRAAGCPVLTDDVCVSDTLAGIRATRPARARCRTKRWQQPPPSCAACWR
jgi:hypothetical protein